MFALARVEDPDDDLFEHDDVVYLNGVSWSDYERLLKIRGDKSAPRITYLQGQVEIMSPSRTHESVKSYLGCLIEVWCVERDIPFTPVGSWTLKDRKEERGAEPDECYVLGADQDVSRPHLVIEVERSSRRIDKLEVYRRLGVREVWYWRKGRLGAHALRGDRYVPIGGSEVLPGLDPEFLSRFLDRPSAYHAIRDFRAALTEK